MRPFPHRFIRSGLSILAVAFVLSACSKPEQVAEPIRAVRTVTVGASASQSSFEYAAEIRARVESRLAFRVGGKMLRRNVELGHRVKAGQVLAQLDPSDYQLSAEAARAQFAAAQTNRDLAAADFKRYKDLRAQNFISDAELERREAGLKAAQAQLDQAQAQLRAQGNQTSYTSLVADADGVVTSVEADPGQIVSAGTPVVRVARDGPRDVVFAVPEDRVAAFKVGSMVNVRLWSGESEIKASVRDVAASADPVTRTFTVKAGIDAKQTPALGSTVTAMQVLQQDSAAQTIKLPTSAFMKDGQKSAVWIVDGKDMTVHMQPVEIFAVDGNDVVIKSGLKAGDQVVVAGVHVLTAGQKVTFYKETSASAGN